MLRTYLVVFISSLLAFSCAPSARNSSNTITTNAKDVADQRNSQFEEFKVKFLDEFWSHQPGWATYVGYYKYDAKLVVPNADSRRAQAEFARRSLQTLDEFQPSTLSVANATDHALIKNQLESGLWYLNEFKIHEWDPAQYNVANIFGLILNTNYKPLDQRLMTISQRLTAVPAYYLAAQESLTNPTAEHTLLAIEQNRGALNVFSNLIPQQVLQSGLSQQQRAELDSRLQLAIKAINDYVAYLEGVQASFSTQPAKAFRIGKELYEQKFQYDIVSDLSAEELYRKAIAEKNSLHERMYKITAELWPTYLAGQKMPAEPLQAIKMMIDHLSARHIERENFVAEIRRQMPIIQKFMDDNELLDSDPTRPLVVREAPEYQRGFAGASVDAPGPYDATANTYYNVTPLDDFTPEQAASYLREYNHWILQILNIHEAIPGHYTQLMHANKSPSKIKSVFGNGAMIEGWAVYSELMMMEAGYGDNAPEMWLMYSKWNLRAVINTILDYQVQVLGMEKDAALKMLMEEGFQEQAEATGKWRRATLSQVQLTSYYNGYAEILAFREELKEKMGERFDLRTFHNKFLSYGNAPVPVIRRLMLEEWGLAGAS